MREVNDTFKNTTFPIYVLFISDGGVHNKKEITKLMQEASSYPIFWQFMGVGGHSYGILKELDSMQGRLVDNANFFAIDDFRTVSNDELYERLLNEFPNWLKKAENLHIIYNNYYACTLYLFCLKSFLFDRKCFLLNKN